MLGYTTSPNSVCIPSTNKPNHDRAVLFEIFCESFPGKKMTSIMIWFQQPT